METHFPLSCYPLSDFNALLANLTAEERANECVQHALDVRSSLATSNYHRFFRLFLAAPKMGPYMMDHFVERERISALMVMTKAFVISLSRCLHLLKPGIRYKTLPLTYIANELAFDDTAAAAELLHRWAAAFYVPPPPAPAPTAKPISFSLSKTPKIAKLHDSAAAAAPAMQIDQKPEKKEDERVLDCKLAHAMLITASQTFNKVDIKVRPVLPRSEKAFADNFDSQ